MTNTVFTGRQEELVSLNWLLRKKTASLVVVSGRRRIGKSRLIEEFAKNKLFFHLTGLLPTDKTTAETQRNEFAKQVAGCLDLPKYETQDWSELFSVLAKHTQKGRVIILLDEITWMGSKDPDFLGKLKNAWDLNFNKNPQLILCLCGSVSGWIEKNIISNTGFLGRISLKITLEEMLLEDCNQFLERLGFNRSAFEKFMILSVTGGIPWYLEQIDPTLSATENIQKLCFIKNGVLLDEFKHIFSDLFGRRKTICRDIVRFLAKGPAEFAAIAKQLNYQVSGALSEYLDDLLISGFISRDFTWHVQSGKEAHLSHYRLSDNYLRFFLKYIEPNQNQIRKGHYKHQSLDALPGWSTMMGLQFENLILNNRHRIHKVLGIRPEDIVVDNPFFQTKTTRREACQIDYLIQTRLKTLFACEIKFSRNEIKLDIIKTMQDKLKKLSLPKGFACLPVLIHVHDVQDSVLDANYFFKVIDARDWLNAE